MFGAALSDTGPGRRTVQRQLTQVHVQQMQMGLGCVNSWGAWPQEQYLLRYANRDFTFVIKPYRK